MPLPKNIRDWTKQLLKYYNFRAGEKMGQHFLVEAKVLDDMIKVANLIPGERVVEVGGGWGVLTISLLDAKAKVVTVELDKKLAKALAKLIFSSPHFQVVNADIIKLTDHYLLNLLNLNEGEKFSILSNLPYEITGAFLRKFLESNLPIRQLVVLLQYEVAERLTAGPGDMSLLGVLANLNAEIKLVRKVEPISFLPPPKVKSAIVKIYPFSQLQKDQLLQGVTREKVWQVARVGFAAKRKQLINNLLSVSTLTRQDIQNIFIGLGLKLDIRAEDLSVNDWVNLAKNISF